MRICFLVDARSPIAINWISYFIKKRHDVHVISSHACRPEVLEGATIYQAPIAFGGIGRSLESDSSNGRPPKYATFISALRSLDRVTNGVLRSWFTLIDLLPHVGRVRRLCDAIAPDLVHAMRIPYEGIMASLAVRHRPLLISCWGNDFTLYTATASNRFLTRHAMRRTDALHCDCERDVALARRWGFHPDKPSIVLPSAGGVDASVFHPGQPDLSGWCLNLPADARVVINPRGIRLYVRNDSFFQAIPLVLRVEPLTFFICLGMRGEPYAENLVRDLGVAANVRLLPTVSRDKLAELFRAADVSVSPSTHDGTPNTLLEAMASGCFPLAGDIESVCEWIDHGSNGLLCDPKSAGSIAAEIISALRDPVLRQRAAAVNVRVVSERAEYGKTMVRAELFYRDMIGRFHRAGG